MGNTKDPYDAIACPSTFSSNNLVVAFFMTLSVFHIFVEDFCLVLFYSVALVLLVSLSIHVCSISTELSS